MGNESRLKILPRKELILSSMPTSKRSPRTTYTRIPTYEPGRVLTWLIDELMKEIQIGPMLKNKYIAGQVP